MKPRSPNLARVWITIPKGFLEQFDQAVQGNFASRSEAIRRGMQLVLREIELMQGKGSEAKETRET